MDNGGVRYGAMESALRPPLPTANPALAGIQTQVSLDQRLGAKHHRRDPRKQTPGGRHQIGIPAGFKSESVAGFLLESVADIIGIRTHSYYRSQHHLNQPPTTPNEKGYDREDKEACGQQLAPGMRGRRKVKTIIIWSAQRANVRLRCYLNLVLRNEIREFFRRYFSMLHFAPPC